MQEPMIPSIFSTIPYSGRTTPANYARASQPTLPVQYGVRERLEIHAISLNSGVDATCRFPLEGSECSMEENFTAHRERKRETDRQTDYVSFQLALPCKFSANIFVLGPAILTNVAALK